LGLYTLKIANNPSQGRSLVFLLGTQWRPLKEYVEEIGCLPEDRFFFLKRVSWWWDLFWPNSWGDWL